jgi:hypothetical protein
VFEPGADQTAKDDLPEKVVMRAHTTPCRVIERTVEAGPSAHEKVGAKADGCKQGDAEHRLFMPAHSGLSLTGREGTHNRHVECSFLRNEGTIRRLGDLVNHEGLHSEPGPPRAKGPQLRAA